jgi:hypothetical protein
MSGSSDQFWIDDRVKYVVTSSVTFTFSSSDTCQVLEHLVHCVEMALKKHLEIGLIDCRRATHRSRDATEAKGDHLHAVATEVQQVKLHPPF